MLVDADHGKLNLRSRSGRDVTDEYPQFEALAADLADHHVILDGEAVALDAAGVPSFGEMQNRARSTRVEFWAFDILHLDGRSLLRAKYSDRRRAAGGAGRRRRTDRARRYSPATAPRRWSTPASRRWEGVVAKKRDSTYQPGRRSASWIKDKIWNTQEVVIGGWREGEGGRTSGIGALMLGIPSDGGLQFAGPGGHRVHRQGADQAQEDPHAAAYRRIAFQHKASHAGRQGRDVRAARVGRGGALQRAHLRRPAAPTQLARAAAGQDPRRGALGGRIASLLMSSVSVITGGAGGMGVATAKIVGRDHTVVLCDVRQDRLDEAAATLEAVGITCKAVNCDVTDQQAVDALIETAAGLGTIASVIHTAGVSPSMGDAGYVMRTNAIGTLNAIDATYDDRRRRPRRSL